MGSILAGYPNPSKVFERQPNSAELCVTLIRNESSLGGTIFVASTVVGSARFVFHCRLRDVPQRQPEPSRNTSLVRDNRKQEFSASGTVQPSKPAMFCSVNRLPPSEHSKSRTLSSRFVSLVCWSCFRDDRKNAAMAIIATTIPPIAMSQFAVAVAKICNFPT